MPITEQFKQIFSRDYCGFDTFFKKVLAPLFGDKIERKNENLLTDDRYRDKAEKLKIKTMTFVALVEAFDPINVIDITVDNSCNLARSRVYIKELVRQMLENYAQAFIIFHYENVKDMPWRFSYIYKEGRQTDVTAPKRFTYVFGRDYSGRTAAERFATLQGKTMDSAEDFKDAFSVESLSDEFFYNYRAIYANFVQYITGKRIVKKGGKWEEEKIHDPNEKLYNAFNRDDKRIRDYIKKTLGRLTFLYFVERKGWLNNNRNFMRQLFEGSKYKDDYLDCVLEPLFYTILNTAPDDRRAIFEQHNENCDCEKEVEWDIDLLDQWKDIPFLNGGLFERDEDDVVRTQFPSIFFSNPNSVENYAGKEKDYIPGRDYDWEQVPGLLDFFEQYNFTIDENDPNDAEVGVDPEMLGRIFENLLEDNKDKGAFYTPKEIVQYMCRESLIAYLQTDATDDAHRERLRRFVETHDAAILHDAEYVLKKIENVKICDPAIGSGAFPMGLLNELVACREALGLHIDKDVNRAEIKKHIIQNSIYGVDIEKGAVDIARLRFWLSIVVDEESSLTLPNLDYKIMQGNSLLESFMGVDLSRILPENTTSVVLAFDDETAQQTLLYEKLHRYFDTGKHSEKAKLRTDIDNLVKGLVKVRTAGRDDITNALANFDVSGNDQFFLWHTWFHDVFSQGGFDIVIANPPYIGEKGHKEIFQLVKSDAYLGKFHLGKMDYFYFFFHFAFNVLKNSGIGTFITTNYYLTALGAKKLRQDIKERMVINILLNFGELKLFENAPGQHNMISSFAKGCNGNKCHVIDVHKKGSLNPRMFETILSSIDKDTSYDIVEQENLYDGDECYIRLHNDNGDSPLASILQKISQGNEVLGNIAEVNAGIMGGCDNITNHNLEYADEKYVSKNDIRKGDGVFVLDRNNSRDSLKISVLEKSNLCKDFYKNSDIKKYCTNTSTSKIIIFSSSDTPTDVQTNIKSILQIYKPILVRIREINKENTDYWHQLRRGTAHPHIFTCNKIVCPQRSKLNTFGYNECDWYASADVYYITNPKVGYQIKYLLGLLNSKLIYIWLYNKGKRKGEFLELYQKPLSEIPIKKASLDEQELIVFYVDKILSAKKVNPLADTTAEEHEIDLLVYKLYGLTEDEIKIVEGTK